MEVEVNMHSRDKFFDQLLNENEIIFIDCLVEWASV
jgi:hypothetical protein